MWSLQKHLNTWYVPTQYRTLLHVEWVLGLLAIFLVLVSHFLFTEQSSVSGTEIIVVTISFIVFMLLGLRHPIGTRNKLFYILAQIALVIFLVHASSINLTELLLIIVLLRCCLLYSGKIRWLWALVIFSIYAVFVFQLYQESFGNFLPPITTDESLNSGMVEQEEYFSTTTDTFFEPLNQKTILLFTTEQIVFFGLIMLFVFLLTRSYITERESRLKLAVQFTRAQQKVHGIAAKASETERQRIARDLHDTLGHVLSDQYLLLERITQQLQTQEYNELPDLLTESKQNAKLALAQIRSGLHTLRHVPLEHNSLEGGIQALIQRLPIPVTCAFNWQPYLGDEQALTLYYIVCEAIKNIEKHSGATRASVTFDHVGESLQIVIADNGRGFTVDSNTSGYGLRGMRERTDSLSGTLSIESSKTGTKIRITIPCPV